MGAASFLVGGVRVVSDELSELPRFAVVGHYEAVCLAVVESVALVVVGQNLMCPCCDVADVSKLRAETAVCDWACCLSIAPLHAVQEVCRVVKVIVVGWLHKLGLKPVALRNNLPALAIGNERAVGPLELKSVVATIRA